MPKSTYRESIAHLEDIRWEGWDDMEWTQIPSDFWVSERIHWKECWAEGVTKAFCMIFVDVAKLIECFPPELKKAEDIASAGSVLVKLGSVKKPQETMIKRGRRPFDWDSFHVEVTKRLLKGNVPRKQEAFIAEMQ